ncbi:MAG: alanyl-tRNA editing protein [Blautia sp.]|nr:alanyl-tRNA editing protein [Blautia sp.]
MIQTRRLYYEDSYRKEFTARVMDCREGKRGWLILLDQTAFYPEGGGQPADHGLLFVTYPDACGEQEGKKKEDAALQLGIEVTDVHEKDGEILHRTQEPIPAGSLVIGQIDWERRFDLMQQHSGEHMVSGLIHSRFGYNNVGFHLGSDVVTIDFDGLLTAEDVKEIEANVNALIWENTPVEIFYPSPEELSVLDYRSKKELTQDVRIVRFPGADTCACCGTHVAGTGAVGMAKLLSVTGFREGVRIEMICGRRVLTYLNQINEQNHRISVRLSAKIDRTAEAVDRLAEENFQQKGRILTLEEEAFAAKAREQAGKGNVLLLERGLASDSVRKLCDTVMQTCGGRCAVFSENPDGSFKYAIGQKDADLRTLVKEMNQALSGRGGGKPFFVQGSVKASLAEIQTFWNQAAGDGTK